MKKVRLLFSLLFAVVWASGPLMLIGCGEDEEVASAPSVGGDPEDPGDEVPVDQERIFIEVTGAAGWTSLMHENTGIGDACEILPEQATTAAEKYISCTLEVPELSLWLFDISLTMNVPQTTCRAVQITPYWFANFDIGTHESTVFVETQTDDNGTVLQYQCSNAGYGALTACNTSQAEAIADGDSWYIDNSGAPVCLFDHSFVNDLWPNCCQGSFTLNTRNYDTINLTTSGATSTLSSFGNTYDPQCFGGPFSRSDDWPKSMSNQPRNLIVASWLEGYAETHLLTSPSAYLANQFSVINGNYFSGGIGLPNPISSTYTNSIGQTPVSPEENYQLSCLDEGWEVIYSIKLKVREWNTIAAFDTFLVDGTGNPDVTGVEGTNCDYEDPDAGPCNDNLDWDDFTTNWPLPSTPLHYPRSIW